VNYSGGEIITISAAGMTSVFASGFNALDGIAVDDDGGRLFVADSGDDLLYAVQISDGVRTVLDSFDFDLGWYPSGLAFDGVQNLLMATGENDLYVEGYAP